ncbi:MAG TPA: chaperone modulator CbpM [Desulfomicrobiaceae bacterium]|nr:chaperone modulator CbpM [Desulfomicrobiaceae bacterium]
MNGTIIPKDMKSAPVRSEKITIEQFVESTGASSVVVLELVEMGWLDPERTGRKELLFRDRDVDRVRKFLRLCADFELTPVGGSIIVDLLERVEQLERELKRARKEFSG